MAGPVWGWDVKAKRYRDLDTGRFMPRQRVLDFVSESIRGTQVVTDRLAGYVADGSTSPKDFGDLLRKEVKSAYLQEYLLGRGGRHQMTKADWGSIGGSLKEAYSYIPGFVADLEKGKLSEAQIAARARMYVESSRESFFRAHERNADELGLTEMLWVVDPAKENCPDCLAYAAMGWVPPDKIPTRPGRGDTICLTACGCVCLWRDPETGVKY